MNSSTQSSWSSYFDHVMVSIYGEAHRLAPLFELIIKYSERSGSNLIVEAGCGTGTSCFLLGQMGYKACGFDILPDVIERIKEKTPYYYSCAHFETRDMCDSKFSNNQFGVCFSQGVHEHFDDELIVRAIREQLRIARYVIIDVPNSRGNIRPYGDERLLHSYDWRRLFGEAQARVVEERGRMLPKWTKLLPAVFHSQHRKARFKWLYRLFGTISIFVLESEKCVST